MTKREKKLPTTVVSQLPEDTNSVNHSLNHSKIELKEQSSPNSNLTGNFNSNVIAEHELAFDTITQELYSALKMYDPVKADQLLASLGTPQRS